VALVAALVVGILLGRALPLLWLWLSTGGLSALMMLLWLWRGRNWPAMCWSLVAVATLGAAWLTLDLHHLPRDHISRFLPGGRGQPATVIGQVAGPVRQSQADRGPFREFSYRPETTRARLHLKKLHIDGQWRPVSGGLRLTIHQPEPRLKPGQRIRATGWISRARPPANPGAFDYRQWLRQEGLAGQLVLPRRENWTLRREAGGLTGWIGSLHGSVQHAAERSLLMGLPRDSGTRPLLKTMLLGQWDGDSVDLRREFRKVGLAHLLAVSGAHVGILLLLFWGMGRLTGLGPRTVAGLLLVVLLLYVLLVPARVPILRAGVMAGLLILGRGVARQATPVTLLGVAAMGVLLWRPTELFSPGFQLSFAAVTGLVTFTKPVSYWLWSPPLDGKEKQNWAGLLWRRAVEYVAVCLVAAVMVTPIVAYHFHQLHPLTVVLSVLAWPVFAGALGLGYLKLLTGLLWPSVGWLLAGPTATLAGLLAAGVAWVARWPVTPVTLSQPPTLAWVAGGLGVALGAFSGRFAGRRWAFAVAVVILAGWTFALERPGWAGRNAGDDNALTVRMLAVGDGACYLLQSAGETIVFDCGSRSYGEVGKRTVLPALRQLGVGPVEALVLSHADMDHYNGAVALARHWPIENLLAPPALIQEARRAEEGPVNHLIEALEEAGLAPTPVTRGFRRKFGRAELTVLWPPRDHDPATTNDGSLVIAVKAGGRRVLLNGDIQASAIDQLLNSEVALEAAVTDLPHHGSFVDGSRDWLEAINPALVLQSSGRPDRPEPWKPVVEKKGIPRLISHNTGMATVRISKDGEMTVNRWLDN